MVIDYVKLAFLLKAETEINLPSYKGSTLRGGFGRAFRETVCALKRRRCEECMLKSRCIYVYVFETEPQDHAEIMHMSRYERIPHPFIIEPPEEKRSTYVPGSHLNFNLVLIGKAIEYLPFFVFSFLELGKKGIGRKRGKYSVAEIRKANDNCLVYTTKDQKLDEVNRSTIEIPEDFSGQGETRRITLRLLTPLRIKYKRELVFDLHFHMLLRNLLRRLTLIYYFHCESRKPQWDLEAMIAHAEEIKTVSSDLKWFDWERYSSRQNARLRMGGIIGEITFEGIIDPFIPVLKAGEILHAGKGTTFGLGRYEIIE